MHPPSGSMVYWRFKARAPCPWIFGYCTYLSRQMLRMGAWNGDTVNGPVVAEEEVEWREYNR